MPDFATWSLNTPQPEWVLLFSWVNKKRLTGNYLWSCCQLQKSVSLRSGDKSAKQTCVCTPKFTGLEWSRQEMQPLTDFTWGPACVYPGYLLFMVNGVLLSRRGCSFKHKPSFSLPYKYTNISLFRPEQSSTFRGVLPCALRGPHCMSFPQWAQKCFSVLASCDRSHGTHAIWALLFISDRGFTWQS